MSEEAKEKVVTLSPEDIHAAYEAIFLSREGEIVLADLVRHFGFTTRSTLVPGDTAHSAYQEGQRTVMVHIMKVLEGHYKQEETANARTGQF